MTGEETTKIARGMGTNAAWAPNGRRSAIELLFCDEIHLEYSASELAAVELILALLNLTKKLFDPWKVTGIVEDTEEVDQPFVLIIVWDDTLFCGPPHLMHLFYTILTVLKR